MIPAGLLLDRLSVRKLILTGLAIMLLAILLLSYTHIYWVAAACRFVVGMMASLSLISAIRLTARWFEMRYAGLVLGIVITFAMFGGMLAQYIAPLAHYLGDWRNALQMVVILGCLLWVINFIFVKDYPEHMLAQHTQQPPQQYSCWHSIRLVLKNSQIWVAGLYTNLLNIPILVLGALWGHDYLTTAKSISSTSAITVTSMIFLGMIFGSPLSGWLSDTLKKRKLPMIVGAVLSFIIILIVYYTHTHNGVYLGCLFFLIGLCTGTQVISYPYFVEVSSPHITATSASLGSTIIVSSGAIFQPLFGYLLQQHAITHNSHHTYTAANYEHAFIIFPIAFAMAIVLSLFLKETKCQHIA